MTVGLQEQRSEVFMNLVRIKQKFRKEKRPA
jgi:hypothetical protein